MKQMIKGSKALKVLVLSHSSELSGAELSMLDLFDYWVDKRWVDPYFIIRRPLKNMAPALQKRGWDHTALYYTNWSQRSPTQVAEHIYRGTLFNTKAIFAIEKLITEFKPDVVMTNTIVSPWAAIAAYFQGIPHIWFVREYGDSDHRHIFEIGREKMLQDIDTLSKLVVTNSQTLAEDLGPDIDISKITTLYTPFNLDLLKQKSRQQVKNPYKSKSSLKLVITGKIAPTKGQAEAAEAVGRLNQMGHDIELCVIGQPVEPGDDSLLNEKIQEYGLQDRVHLIGHKLNPLAYVALADVGITASYREAFGRVTFEYMAIGKPVVGADSGATPEMVDQGKNGYLYKLGDINSLVNQLLRYADDRNLVLTHGEAAARKTGEMMSGSFNADALIKKIRATIEDSTASQNHRQLNYAHRWLEYPSIAEKYISDTGVISLHWIIYRRMRHWAKLIYLRFTAPSDKDRRNI